MLLADEEVAVLLPQWNGKIPFDMHSILSIDDLCDNIDEYINSECRCCGYPENGTQRWSDVFTLVDRASAGYFQTEIAQGENPVSSGYSGGIVLTKNKRCFYWNS